jgi:hypothetical protein
MSSTDPPLFTPTRFSFSIAICTNFPFVIPCADVFVQLAIDSHEGECGRNNHGSARREPRASRNQACHQEINWDWMATQSCGCKVVIQDALECDILYRVE